MNAATVLWATVISICTMTNRTNGTTNQSLKKMTTTMETIKSNDSTSIIYFAGGCFWGTEQFFKKVNGVTATEVGFANGNTENPTYKDVVYNNTGFAETVKVTYNPQKLDLNLLLDLFFLTIDPTSLNKQGNDFGTQYRTGVYYTSDEQLPLINERIKAEATKYDSPLVVEVLPLKNYYKAEDYHQDYLEHNPGGYCHINPALFKVAEQANKDK